MQELSIAKRLSNLSMDAQVLWSVHVIKRLWPNYEYFSRLEKFGDSTLVKEVLFQVKKYFSDTLDTSDIESLREQLLVVAPHSDEYPSIYATYALDACAACDDLLKLIGIEDQEAVLRISELSINTVYTFILDKMNIQSGITDYPDQEIYSSKEMIEEYKFQENLINRVSGEKSSALIDEAFNVEYSSNIGLIF